jgi:hypothetical protein
MNRSERITGPKAILAETFFAASLVFAGCSSPATIEAPKPTPQPTENPTPSLVVTSTPEAIPTPVVTPAPTETPTATSTPSPEATPKPESPITVENVINDLNAGGKALDKYKKPITITALRTSFETLLKSPAASYITEPKQFDSCTDPKMNIRTKQLICFFFTYDSLTAAGKTADPAAIDFAQKLMRYDLTKVYFDPNPHINQEIIKNLADNLQINLIASENN